VRRRFGNKVDVGISHNRGTGSTGATGLPDLWRDDAPAESGHCGQLSRERSSAILRTNAAKKATEKVNPKTSAVVVAVFPIVCPFQMSATAPVNIVSGRQTTITMPRINIAFSRHANLLDIG
jgi:hypothetical protein